MTPAVLLLALRLLLAIGLYAFLAWVLILVWRDLRAATVAGEAVPAAQLRVVGAPASQDCFTLGAVNTLGRAADNTVCIPDETVSAYHARLSHHDGQWWLEDLGSRNGTRVNELPVDQPLVITYGDRLWFGQVEANLEVPVPPSPAGS